MFTRQGGDEEARRIAGRSREFEQYIGGMSCRAELSRRKADMTMVIAEVSAVAAKEGVFQTLAMHLESQAERGRASEGLLHDMRRTVKVARGAAQLARRQEIADLENDATIENIRRKAQFDETEMKA